MNAMRIAATIALLCGCPAAADAVNLNPKGLGQALIYPYYTVNKSQDTYLSIVNPHRHGTVVKVRFLEGRGGRPVVDVDVYLSAHDVWTAAISQTSDNGGAKLTSADHSCTRPSIPAAGLAFTSSGYDGSAGLPADDGPHDIARTREGFIEVIAGGSLGDDDASHAIEAAPVDCSTIFASLLGHVVPPANLSGSAAIIDVGEGTYYAYNADAISSFTARSLYSSTWGPLVPSLADANSAEAENGTAVAYLFSEDSALGDNGQPKSATYADGIDAVSAILMADTIENDYLIDPGLGANTDWLVTFPTRRFYSDPIYPAYRDGANNGATLFSVYAAAFYDREGADALPETQETIELPYSANVISFLVGAEAGAHSGVFGSSLNTNFAPTADSGFVRLDVGGHRLTGSGLGFASLPFGPSQGLYGVPVVGFMAYNVINAHAQPGRLANYGGVFPHHTTTCSGLLVFDPFICRR